MMQLSSQLDKLNAWGVCFARNAIKLRSQIDILHLNGVILVAFYFEVCIEKKILRVSLLVNHWSPRAHDCSQTICLTSVQVSLAFFSI